MELSIASGVNHLVNCTILRHYLRVKMVLLFINVEDMQQDNRRSGVAFHVVRHLVQHRKASGGLHHLHCLLHGLPFAGETLSR